MEEAQFIIMDAELKTYRVTLDNAGEWSAEATSERSIPSSKGLILIAVAASELIGRIKAVIP
jgi:hypothetical protein